MQSIEKEKFSRLLDAFMGGNDEALVLMKAAANERQNELLPKDNDHFKITTVFNDENSSAIKIYDFLNRLDPDWWEWEIETLDKILLVNYGVALDEVNRDKVLAIRHVCNSDGCFIDWFEFNQVALAFAGSIADFDALRIPSPGMAISALKTMNYIRPDRNGEISNDLKKYLCILFFNEGIYTPPPSLMDIIGEEMAKIVKPEMKEKWVKILERFKQLLTDKNIIIEENDIDIQAKRLINAEGSAQEYSN
jgi:hypothetical protein